MPRGAAELPGRMDGMGSDSRNGCLINQVD
jgi:hypothetical protein